MQHRNNNRNESNSFYQIHSIILSVRTTQYLRWKVVSEIIHILMIRSPPGIDCLK